MPRIIVYPGTFDPVTYGHIDLINRALRIFDKVIVAVGQNPAKAPLFTTEERLEMIRDSISPDKPVELESFDCLLVDFARSHGACAILRGLRAVSDFEFELQRAIMNRKLDRNIETVFLMTGFRWIYISSTIVKEAAQFGGSLDGLVPPHVEDALKRRFRQLARKES
jgi:pantetheine-phosphate adenylyltransferase